MNLYWGLVLAAVFGGVLLSYLVPNGPLLAWWMVSGLGLGIWVAFSAGSHPFSERTKRLLGLYGILILMGLLSTQLAARRLTSATHFRYHGVFFERADSIVIASGDTGVDVVLPTVDATQLPWRLSLHRDASGWRLAPTAAVEQVRVSPVPDPTSGGTASRFLSWALGARYAVLNGVVLDRPGDVVIVRDRSGVPLDKLTLEDAEGGAVLGSSRGGHYALNTADPRRRHRIRQMLRFGTTIGSLDGVRNGSEAYDRFVRIQRLSAREEVNGRSAGLGDWLAAFMGVQPTRFLVTAADPFAVDDGVGARSASIPIVDSVRVEVRHLGGRWQFDLVEMRRRATADRGLAVRFVRNPRPLDSPLPLGGSCVGGAACGVLSLRQLPPPVAHISLASAGLDPTRFALLARLEERDRGVNVVLPQDSVLLPAAGAGSGQVTAIPVTDLGRLGSPPPRSDQPPPPSYWVLASSSSNSIDNWFELLPVGLGMLALLFLLPKVVAASPAARSQVASAAREGFLALGMNALLALLLARLIIGARVTFFTPFLPDGLDTAIGLGVAIAVVTTGLLSWSQWAPATLGFGEGLRGRPLTLQAIRSAAKGATTELGMVGKNVWGPLLGWLFLPLGLLAFASPLAVAKGAFCGFLVLSTWFTIAWIAAFSSKTFHSFENGPWEIVEYEGQGATPGRDDVRSLPDWNVILLAPFWALAVWMPPVGVVASLVIPWVIGLVARRAGRKSLVPFGADRPQREVRDRAGPLRLAYFLSTSGVAGLTVASENGALAAFLLVILVALVGVRAGRALSVRLVARPRPTVALVPVDGDPAPSQSAGTPLGVPLWLIVLYLLAPLVLLAPLAFIDMGLLLVMVIPIGAASVLAVGLDRLNVWAKLLSGGLAIGLLMVLSAKVLFPSVVALSNPDPTVRTERFDQMQGLLGRRLPVLGGPLERAAARAVAARAPREAEELLVWARPGSGRDLLIPSIEQAWASRAYSAAGLLGVGLGAAPIGRGIAESVSYAENSYAVYVLHEHGVVGGVAVLLAYLTFAGAVLLMIRATPAPTESLRASRAMFLVAALIVTIPAVYVALSNVGVVPITGQNMPFLGLNAWSDVTLCAGIVGILITGALRSETAGAPRLRRQT